MIPIGAHVVTEWGYGIVQASSTRRIVIALESGETLNIVAGTPGYARIRQLV